MLAIVGDQYPAGAQKTEFKFLGLPTGFMTGAEKMAKMLNAITLYVHLEKNGWGQYTIHLQELNIEPIASEKNEITQKFAHALEQNIEKTPQYWLWSHKRWKGYINY